MADPYDGNTATMPDRLDYHGKNRGEEKETIERHVLVILTENVEHGIRLHEAVDVRLYMGRSKAASTVYATVWVRTRNTVGGNDGCSGSGSAGGYGYCKRSAVVQSAFDNAGIKLAHPIAGRGMEAVYAAMEAVADAAGWADCKVRRIV